MGVAFDIFVRIGDQDTKLGESVASVKDGWMRIDIETDWRTVPQFDDEQVTVILRSNPAIALKTLDLFEIWDGELVFESVPLDRRSDVERLIQKLIEHDNEFVRAFAARALGDMGPAAKDAIPALIKAIAEDDSQFRTSLVAAAKALPKIGPEALTALPALIKAFEDPTHDRVVRTDLAGVFGQLGAGARPAIPALQKAISKDHVAVRIAAVEALAKMGPDAIPALTKALTNDHYSPRRIAAMHLVKMGEPAIPAFIEALKKTSTDDAVRSDGIEGLVSTGANALPAILTALRGDDAQLQKGVAEATDRIAQRLASEGATEHIAALENILEAIKKARVGGYSAQNISVMVQYMKSIETEQGQVKP